MRERGEIGVKPDMAARALVALMLGHGVDRALFADEDSRQEIDASIDEGLEHFLRGLRAGGRSVR